MKRIMFVLLIVSCVAGCGRNRRPVAAETILTPEQAIDAAHTSLTSLDYLGSYEGTLPCADCEGIRTVIFLGEETYTIKTEYKGKPAPNFFESEGEYYWDDSGSTVTLAGEPVPNKYKVGENVLIKLDAEGNEIQGKLAGDYRLKKVEI